MSRVKLLMCCAFVMSITSCTFMVEERGTRDGYYYCDEVACWECDATTCHEVVPAREGDACVNDFECAKGLYCNEVDRCERTDTCLADTDCLSGEICQSERGTCAPAVECFGNAECASGFCAGGLCRPAEMCGPDGGCDEDEICDARNLCIPVETETMCQAAVATACAIDPPTCNPGTTAAIQNGCYTGECVANAVCADDNPCSSNTREECATDQNLGRCAMIFRGVNCTGPGGTPCDTPNATCSCESFLFNYCESVP